MKVIHSKGRTRVVVAISDAKIIYACLVEATISLEDWEYEIKIGVPKDKVEELIGELKGAIVESGFWGTPLPREERDKDQ